MSKKKKQLLQPHTCNTEISTSTSPVPEASTPLVNLSNPQISYVLCKLSRVTNQIKTTNS